MERRDGDNEGGEEKEWTERCKSWYISSEEKEKSTAHENELMPSGRFVIKKRSHWNRAVVSIDFHIALSRVVIILV